jgi:hypothetical protein
MRIRFTASAADGLWLHVDGPTKKAGFSLGQLKEGMFGQVLDELREALLDGRDYGVSPYYEVAAAAHTPAEALAMK